MEWERKKGKKKQSNAPTDFILVNVMYEDGSQRSNRRVPLSELSGIDDEADIQRAIEEQDDKIAELSGQPRAPIKSITRVSARR